MLDNFDTLIDRLGTDSIKWNKYPSDVLPLWVADMDFASPPAVLQALHERVAHGVFGYGSDTKRLSEILMARLFSLYRWRVTPDDIVYLPGVVSGFNLACLAFAEEGERVVVQTPVYPPLLKAAFVTGRDGAEVGFNQEADGKYVVDWECFESTLGDQARLFILCNPQNPLGRVFTRAELEKMAAVCLRDGTVICSDEIHCDLSIRGPPAPARGVSGSGNCSANRYPNGSQQDLQFGGAAMFIRGHSEPNAAQAISCGSPRALGTC